MVTQVNEEASRSQLNNGLSVASIYGIVSAHEG